MFYEINLINFLLFVMEPELQTTMSEFSDRHGILVNSIFICGIDLIFIDRPIYYR